MHTYIGSKKTASGYGLLLIEFEKNSSISLLAIDRKKLSKKPQPCTKKIKLQVERHQLNTYYKQQLNCDIYEIKQI
jgi:hypothetical protein